MRNAAGRPLDLETFFQTQTAVSLGLGDGTFSEATQLYSGLDNGRIGALADFDSDGLPDLLVPSSNPAHEVHVRLNAMDEACDDGNLLDDDGCDASCLPTCGNAALDPGEACDDGNTQSGDGCESDCQL